jgi:ribosomal protein L36
MTTTTVRHPNRHRTCGHVERHGRFVFVCTQPHLHEAGRHYFRKVAAR